MFVLFFSYLLSNVREKKLHFHSEYKFRFIALIVATQQPIKMDIKIICTHTRINVPYLLHGDHSKPYPLPSI